DIETVQARRVRERIAIGGELARERLRIAVVAPLPKVAYTGCIAQHQAGRTAAVAEKRAISALREVAQFSSGTIPCVEIATTHQGCNLLATVVIEACS